MRNYSETEDAAHQHERMNLSHDRIESPEGEGVNMRYIFAVVRSNLKMIIIVFMAIFALTGVVTVMTTPRYQASADIQVNNSSGRLLKSQDDDESSESGSSLDTDRFLQTQVDVLKSRGMAERVAKKMNLGKSAAFFAGQGQPHALDGHTPKQLEDAAIRMLMKNVEVTLPKDTRIIKLSFESTDPGVSADVANAYVSEFIQFNLQRKFESSSYARNFLANQLIEVRQKLEESERNLNTYSRSAGLIRMSVATPGGTGGAAANAVQQSASVTTSSLVQLNQAANDAKAKRIAAEARWNAINHGPLLNAMEVVSNQGVQSLLSQRATIATTLEQDKARHLADYPTVKAEQAQLASINSQIQASANAIRNAVKADYTAALATEQDLNAQVSGLKSETLDEQDRTVRYGLLARDVDTNREVYESLLQRYKELNASAGISASNVWVIDNAIPPTKPSSPDLVKNLAIGFVLALVITAAIVVIKDQFDDSVRIPEDIETKLGLSLLGVVPKSNKALAGELNDAKSSVTEAYNSIRASLLFSTPSGMPKVLLVTSAQPAEGKTTSSFALSLALSRTGRRVVLFDADLRRPALHRWIEDDNERGFSTLLTSRDSVESVVKPTSFPNLWLVPSGPIPPSPTELLASNRMQEVIREASGQFDVVVIDSAPILGLADAPMMSALVDGVIFVVEADRSRHGSLKGSLRRLRNVHAPILGAMLTKFDPLKANNRYGSYYGYEYYQYQYQYGNEGED